MSDLSNARDAPAARAKNVAFVSPSAYPLGGVAVWLDYLCRGLSRDAFEPTVLLTAGRHHDAGNYVRSYPSLPWQAVVNPTGSRVGRIRALAAAIRARATDVLVSVNIVDTFRAAIELSSHGDGVRPRVAIALHALEPALICDIARYRDAIDAVVTTNRLAQQLVAEYSQFPVERIFYAPYGVAISKFVQVPDKRSDGPIRLLFVGRLEQSQKRILDIASIVSRLDAVGCSWELSIAGTGPDLGLLARALHDYSGKVDWLGAVSADELSNRVYAAHDVLLITSDWETGPIVAWEAMAARLPIVCSRYLGSVREAALVSGGNCLMYEPGDCQAAADAIAALFQQRELRSKIVAEALDLVRSRYSQEASVMSWENALSNIAQLPFRPAADIAALGTSGRLDGIVGVELGETIRRLFGARFNHIEAGSEWPHTDGCSHDEAKTVLELARRIELSDGLEPGA